MTLNLAFSQIEDGSILAYQKRVDEAHQWIRDRSAQGGEFLGWVDFLSTREDDFLEKIKRTAARVREDADVVLICGIGGSFLGAKAMVDALTKPSDRPQIRFVGNSLSSADLSEILEELEGKSVYLNVISKSGTTLEPAVSFRILRQYIEDHFEDAHGRIIATTDEHKGALRALAEKCGYETYVVPDDVGGRFSVHTAVGLLPMAIAGIDIDRVAEGIMQAEKDFSVKDLHENLAYRYAVCRHILYENNKAIEVLVQYEPRLRYFSEWFKQLYGESEGKDGKGIFPASVINTMDLHSMGQYLQDGVRNLFETVIDIKNSSSDITIKEDQDNHDGLNYLAGVSLQEMNRKAMYGTVLAHVEGGVPNLILEIEELDAYHLGYLLYFFMMGCAMSGYLLGVNPFDQPGVESYKVNMMALLGKPGLEDVKKRLEQML